MEAALIELIGCSPRVRGCSGLAHDLRDELHVFPAVRGWSVDRAVRAGVATVFPAQAGMARRTSRRAGDGNDCGRWQTEVYNERPKLSLRPSSVLCRVRTPGRRFTGEPSEPMRSGALGRPAALDASMVRRAVHGRRKAENRRFSAAYEA